MNNEQKPIITLFEENEHNISVLYAIYARKISTKSAFWKRLSAEEIAHSKHLAASVDDPFKQIMGNKFSNGVIRYVMDFVLDEIQRAEKEKVSHEDALRTALRIERSMLEKKCFDMFIPTDKKLKDVMDKLNGDTERHIDVLLEEMRKNKFVFTEKM